jgi:hypothetical protein
MLCVVSFSLGIIRPSSALGQDALQLQNVWFLKGFLGNLISVRKTGPRSNKIKQMQKQNTEDTQYKRDTDLRGSPSVGYVHQRNCQVLPLLLSSKMKG